MPTITSAGVGSGLDVAGLVDKLVAAEGEPVKIRLDRKEVKLQAELSAMGTFKGAVSGFQSSLEALRNSDTFGNLEVTSSDEEMLAATAGQDAQPGDYEIEVLQLARSHKLSSSSLESDRLPLGTGSLTIQLGRVDVEPGTELTQASRQFVMNPNVPAKTITITDENSSLRGIQKAINKADAGVRASVINDGNGYRLVLSSLVAGNDNSIRVKVNDNDSQDQDSSGLSVFAYESDKQDGIGQNMKEVVATQNAELNVDGIFVSRSNNDIDDVLDDITLSLKSGSEGSINQLHLELSTDKVTRAVNDFISKYNEMIDTVNSLTGYDAETKTSGPLSGDPSIRGIISQIRRSLSDNFSNVNETYDSLSRIGVDSQRNGKLELNNSKLQTAIEDDLQQVIQLFSISGSSSDPAVSYISAGEETKTGAYNLVVTRMASQGVWGGDVLRPDTIDNTPVLDPATTIGIQLAQQLTSEIFPLNLEKDNSSFKIKVDGIGSQKITLEDKNYYNENELINELQSQINADVNLQSNEVSVEAYLSNGRLLLVSERYGSNSAVEVVKADDGLVETLGFNPGAGIHGEDVTGSFNNTTAIGNGRILSGKGVAENLKVEILEGEVGNRGQIFFSHGVAARLDDLTEQFLKTDGIISVRREGYTNRIGDLTKEREKLAQKLEASEQRYLKQFSALDATLGKMRSTGNFLSNQLDSLPGAAKPK
ncbi:Flagellar cap protein FliD [hydrothermal vent metagenome]|uniref:Filament cap protein n=1 Tax=hydrothermal vent metagenome TaxID=652676 RepID=A0A3B1BGU4_9ZZZZ